MASNITKSVENALNLVHTALEVYGPTSEAVASMLGPVVMAEAMTDKDCDYFNKHVVDLTTLRNNAEYVARNMPASE